MMVVLPLGPTIAPDAFDPTRMDGGESPAASAAAASNADNGRVRGELISARNEARTGTPDDGSPTDRVTSTAAMALSPLRRSDR